MNLLAPILTLSLWCCGPQERVPVSGAAHLEPNRIWNPTTQTVRLEACRGELAAFQIVVDPERERSFGAAATDLHGPGYTIREVSLYHEPPIYVDPQRPHREGRFGAGWYRDALVPLVNPIAIEHGEEVLYISIPVPEDAAAGEYAADVEVTDDAGVRRAVRVRLRVRDLTLHLTSFPFVVGFQATPFLAACGFSTWYDDGGAALNSYLGLAERCGITLGLRGFLPDMKSSGADWTAYDRILGPWIERSKAWMLPARGHFRATFDDQPDDSLAVSSWFSTVEQHWRAKGWPLERAYAWVYDEPRNRQIEPGRVRRYRDTVRRAAPGVRFLVTEALEDSSYLAGADIIAAPGDRYWPAEMRGLLDSGRISGAWVYQCGDPALPLETIDAPAVNFRLWSWVALAYRESITALFYWCGNFWSARPYEIPDGQPASYNDGEGTLFYPGPDGHACSSLRAEAIYAGARDRSLLEMAEGRGLTAVSHLTIARTVPSALATRYRPCPAPGESHYLTPRASAAWTTSADSLDAGIDRIADMLEAEPDAH